MNSTMFSGAVMLFGFVIVTNSTTAFAQAQSITSDACYGGCATASSAASSAAADVPAAIPAPVFKLGIGDVIHISVWREPELSETAIVRPDGRISISLVGEVPVAGESAVAAEARIHELLLKYVTDPQVTVSIVEIHSRQVYITGQVQHPGAYPLLGEFNVLQLIASAGGLTPYARKKGIVILDSTNRQVSRFDYSRAVKGNPSQATMLRPGETVVVP